MADRLCSIDGCERPHFGLGYCSSHHRRLKQYGDPLGQPAARPTACSIEGCLEKVYGRGYCRLHWKRWYRHGDPLHERQVSVGVEPCGVEGCEKPIKARGWCGMHYHRWERHGSPVARVRGEVVDGKRVCPRCGVDTPIDRLNGAYCRPCANARRREWVQVNPQPRVEGTPTPCEWCGTVFLATKRQFHVCSTACKVPAQNRRNWKHVQARRARMAEALVETFSADEIYERDNWTCQLCMEPLRLDGPPRGPLWPSIDHIVPISRGGKHERANVQAAHLICNVRKGVRLPTEVAS